MFASAAIATDPHSPAAERTSIEIDRRHAEHDYRINVKAELEIELLHRIKTWHPR